MKESGDYGKVGFRVYTEVERPSGELVERFASVPVPNLADAMFKFGVMNSSIRSVAGGLARIAGPAITVKVTPGDSLMMRKGMELCQHGDILVIDGGGNISAALLGGNVCIDLLAKGVAGVVVDGAVRDVSEIRELRFPVFAAGVIPRTGTSAGKGEVNTPIACAGVVVMPGDIVVADEEGVAIVPRREAESILERALQIGKERGVPEDLSARLRAAVPGQVYGLERVNRVLAQEGASVLGRVYQP